MSAPFTASPTSFTGRPAFFALSHDAPPLRRPTVTLTPESLRFSVRVALRAVADDRDLLVLDERKIGVLVVKDLHGVLTLG